MGFEREPKRSRALRILREAGEFGAEIIESTPTYNGLRLKIVQGLIDAGDAEWIIEGKRARLKKETT
jgi:hypothetical protein